jgi:hypothetical protein
MPIKESSSTGVSQREWVAEDRYWHEHYRTRPYADGVGYEALRGGYRYGVEASHRHKGQDWEDVEDELARGWESYPHSGDRPWDQVREAVFDAWNRMMEK